MTALTIRVRESRIDLPSDRGVAGRLVVDVPRQPLKVDRGTLVFPWRAGSQDRVVLKVYGEMGIFNWLRKQVVGYRARREFRALARIRDVGIVCGEPMFWGTGRSPEYGLFEVVATREIPGAVTLAERAASLDTAARAEILGQIYETLARIHRAGFFHGAFFLTNVLVARDPDAPLAPCLIDLEKSVYFAADVRGTRMADFDLMCLVNSTFAVMGTGYARHALERYGLDERDIARIFGRLKRTRSSKFLRYRQRAEFIARGLVSRTRVQLFSGAGRARGRVASA